MDRSINGGGIALYVREDILSRQILFKNDNNTEHFFVEINFRKEKWLISCSYKPYIQFIDKHLTHIGKEVDSFSSKYDDYTSIGDFNVELSNNLWVLQPFQNSTIIETGLSDFHKLTVTVFKSYFKKLKSKKLIYRDFKNFSNQHFRTELAKELNQNNASASQFELFQTSLGLLNKLTPSKEKCLRNNQPPFITKEVLKAIMICSRLRNKFLKTKSQECKQTYSKQMNLCVKMV